MPIQEAISLQDREIATLGPEEYKNETFIRGTQPHLAHVPQKYIWDMFASLEGNACPAKEKLGLRRRIVVRPLPLTQLPAYLNPPCLALWRQPISPYLCSQVLPQSSQAAPKHVQGKQPFQHVLGVQMSTVVHSVWRNVKGTRSVSV